MTSRRPPGTRGHTRQRPAGVASPMPASTTGSARGRYPRGSRFEPWAGSHNTNTPHTSSGRATSPHTHHEAASPPDEPTTRDSTMAWSTSDRHSRLPPNWQHIRQQVLTRDHHTCQATHHARGCNGRATDVDHITPGDNNSLTNLQALSAACHRAKTAKESAERARRRAAMKRRPQEQHPGAIAPAGVGVTPPPPAAR